MLTNRFWQPSAAQTTKEVVPKKKDEVVPELTPLEKMLQNAGPLREDGTDKFFGFENVRWLSPFVLCDRHHANVDRSLETPGSLHPIDAIRTEPRVSLT